MDWSHSLCRLTALCVAVYGQSVDTESGGLSAAKFVKQLQRDHMEQQLAAMNRREFSCKRCHRPVRNNVFMEKEVEECDAQEVQLEVDRLICCLHFLAEEVNVYHTLSAYLRATERASRQENEHFSSPFGFIASPRNTTDDQQVYARNVTLSGAML